MTSPFSFPQQSQDQPAGPYTPQWRTSPVQSSAVGLHCPESPNFCWATASLIFQALTEPRPFTNSRNHKVVPQLAIQVPGTGQCFLSSSCCSLFGLSYSPPGHTPQILACGLFFITLQVLTLEFLSGYIHAKLPWLTPFAQNQISLHFYLSHICVPQFPVLNSSCLRYLEWLVFFLTGPWLI